MLTGKGVSRGYAVGKAFVYKPSEGALNREPITPEQVEDRLAEFHAAARQAGAELSDLVVSFSAQAGEENAKIFAAHREILEDEELGFQVEEEIRDNLCEPDLAVHNAVEMFCAILGSAADPLIAARTADLRDVGRRLIRILHGEEENSLGALPRGSIVVAHDLLPSDTASLNAEMVAGIVTEIGGETSHSAILARKLGIPAVLGVENACRLLAGRLLALDAVKGEIIPDPSQEEQRENARLSQKFRAEEELVRQYLDREPLMADGNRVDIGINIGSDQEGFQGCDYVGLFRTEFLYMEGDHLPTEEEQFQAYKRAVERAGGRPVVLRTLDIGGDKTLKYMELPREENPFLGRRALRLCLAEPELFLSQLRAALRASAFGPLHIMFPMVGSLDDLRAAKGMVEKAKGQLREKGQAFREDTPVGIMVEVPSIAVVADLAAREADFASIGTNDLCQYLCAADRMNASVDGYYQSFSPAMLRVIGNVARAFAAEGKPTSVCGEMGGDSRATELLVGLGIRKLSMSGTSVPYVKKALSGFTLPQAQELARKALSLATEREVLELVKGAGQG